MYFINNEWNVFFFPMQFPETMNLLLLFKIIIINYYFVNQIMGSGISLFLGGEWESVCEWVGGQREKERENPKHTPCPAEAQLWLHLVILRSLSEPKPRAGRLTGLATHALQHPTFNSVCISLASREFE